MIQYFARYAMVPIATSMHLRSIGMYAMSKVHCFALHASNCSQSKMSFSTTKGPINAKG